ncbi:DUF3027 domain-containing protein [Pseudolysinimonas sp.]|uniref:DUF3027 domain-containing protein n=1 Tax=Pseudolysinimonas sp. TaxID=2680009 RepID=UPI003F7D54F3
MPDTMTREERDQHLALAALLEITPPDTIGESTGREVAEDGVVTLTFAAAMLGYPGWHWTVSLAEVDDLEPTVLEVELLPGDGALLAPEWVPWSVRLEEYRAAQAAAGATDESVDAAGEDDVDDLDEDDDIDADDDLGDDDLGDDPDDGIDFESAADLSGSGVSEQGVDEQHEADAEPDEDGPEPPAPVAAEDARQEEE